MNYTINSQLLISSERQYVTTSNNKIVQRFHELKNELILDMQNISQLNAYEFSHFDFQFILLNNDISSIPLLCFGHCSNLKNIIIPENCIIIDEEAFLSCIHLTNIKFNSKLKYIKNSAFCNCSELSTIIIPDSVRELGINCFRKCKSLQKVIFSKNIEYIPYNAFLKCDLTSVYIPKNIKYIGPYAFAYNENLIDIKFESSDIEIDYKAFYKTKIKI